MEEKQVADAALCGVLIVRLREADYAARQPPPTVFEATLQSCEDAELAIGVGGAVHVSLLLADGKRFQVPLARGFEVLLLLGDVAQLVVCRMAAQRRLPCFSEMARDFRYHSRAVSKSCCSWAMMPSWW